MTKRKRGRRKQQQHRPLPRRGEANESKSAVAITVAWMMAALATFMAELAGIAAQAGVSAGWEGEFLRLISRVLLFVACFTGVMTLILTPVTLKVRRAAPPSEIVFGALVVGAAPLVIFLITLSRG